MWGWILITWSYLRQSWQRWLIATICLGLVVARIVFPTIRVDWITVVLIVIAVLALIAPKIDNLLPRVMKVLPYIKKAKIAGVEVELSEEIKKLAIDVDKAQVELAEQNKLTLAPDYPVGQAEVLQQLKSDPRAALLLLATKIEQQVMIQLAKHGLRSQGEYIPMHRAIELGVQHNVFPKDILNSFKEFWNIRNQVAHGLAFAVDDSLVLSLVSLGLDILMLISVEGGDGPDTP